MNKKQKLEYDAPMVERFESRVEKGFQASGGTADGPRTREGNEELTEGSSYTGNDFD
ncbi:MAG: hypothetical protein IKG81_07920 [Bacteroidales bacterium]|nr:hypothetical protein [Bacteroidales bacterium]